MKLAPLALSFTLLSGVGFCASAMAENYPVVGSETQQARDDQRSQILNEELATEKKSLERVNAELADAIKGQKTPEEVQGIAAKALSHTSNITSIQREIDGLSGKKTSSRRPAYVPAPVTKPQQQQATQADVDVPYWDVYRRKQSTPPAQAAADDSGSSDQPESDKEASSEQAE
ncbi:hypothetical protein [Pseudomonas viridiflava]|uniref:hypothetical protein n=1 Tax=Pseudomonas viridiflava TaxID=33069 RepID=UPI0013D9BA50|nr:hypothetical protein [Pseudomonas viridiflava]